MSGYLTGLNELNPKVKRHNGGTSSLTLDESGTTNSTLLFISGVAQTPGVDFNVSGTALTTTSAIPAGTNIATTIQYFNTGTVNVPADNTVSGAKIAMGSDAQGDVLYYNGSDYARLAAGTSGEFLKTQGSGANPVWASAGATAVTKQSLSGASVTFSSIPSGVTRIVIAISDCSTDGTDDLGVQIGDSGGIETSGYDSKARDVAHDTDADNTDCFNFETGAHTGLDSHGHIFLALADVDNNTCGASCHTLSSARYCFAGGNKSLSGTLDRVSIMTVGSTSFDAGTVRLWYS